MLCLLFIFIQESIPQKQALNIKDLLRRANIVFKNKKFINGVVISIKINCFVGYSAVFLGILLSYLFTIVSSLSIDTVIIPTALTNIGAGFLFSNIMGNNLKQFPEDVGAAMSVQMCLLAVTAAIGIIAASNIHIVSLLQLSWIFTTVGLLSGLIFFISYQKLL